MSQITELIALQFAAAARNKEVWKKVIVVTPETYGAAGDGETDDTAFIALAIDAIKNDSDVGTRVLELKNKYKANIVLNDIGYIRIAGNGELIGNITVSGTQFSPDTLRYNGETKVEIEGITINGSSVGTGVNLEYIFGISIIGCLFKDCLVGININGVSGYMQNVSRAKFNQNIFMNCQTYLKAISVSGEAVAGDVQFIDNFGYSIYGSTLYPTSGVLLDGMDGIQISDNVFFGDNTTTLEHLNIKNSTWVNVHDNQFFLGKNNGVYIESSQNIIVNNNIFAWQKGNGIEILNAQGLEVNGNYLSWRNAPANTYTGDAIKITSDVSGNTSTWGTVSDNMIVLPFNRGIYGNKVGKLKIDNNNMFASGGANIPPIELVSCEYTTAANNSCIGFPQNVLVTGGFNAFEFSTFYGGKTTYTNLVPKLRTKTYTSNVTTIDLNDVDIVIFANSSATVINTITLTDLTTPREIKFYSYNGNTSFARTTPNLTTYGSASTLKFNSTSSMSFFVNGGALLEMNRNNITEV